MGNALSVAAKPFVTYINISVMIDDQASSDQPLIYTLSNHSTVQDLLNLINEYRMISVVYLTMRNTTGFEKRLDESTPITAIVSPLPLYGYTEKSSDS